MDSLIGPASYGSVDFSGTWFVNSDLGQDYIGFVFGYQTNKKFYAVLWRHNNHNYDANYRAGIRGVQIKVGVSMSRWVCLCQGGCVYVKVGVSN